MLMDVEKNDTPQKNANRKKLKGKDGEAVDNTEDRKTQEISASSSLEDGRTQ